MKTLLLTFYTTSVITPEVAAHIAAALKTDLLHFDVHVINIVIEADNNAVQQALKQAQKNELTLFIKH